MVTAVVGLALLAAVLHAAWNALLKESADPLWLAARAMGSAAVWGTPLAVVAWLLTGRPGLPLEAWILAAVSAAGELIYFVLLSTAYRRGELSVVYPIARGVAPVVAVGIGLLVLHERVGAIELAGVACLLAGVWAVRRPVGAGSALLPALATGVMIAVYSAIDRVGVRLGPPWLYGWALWVGSAALLAGWVRLRAVAGREEHVAPWPRALAVGALMTFAYLFVLVALNLAPLTLVAPLRESAVVLVTAWAIIRLRERRGAWLRLAGAAGIVAGIGLIAAGGK